MFCIEISAFRRQNVTLTAASHVCAPSVTEPSEKAQPTSGATCRGERSAYGGKYVGGSPIEQDEQFCSFR